MRAKQTIKINPYVFIWTLSIYIVAYLHLGWYAVLYIILSGIKLEFKK